MSFFKHLRKFSRQNRPINKFNTFDKQTKIIVGGASILGATAGLSCAYIYCIIESIIVSK